MADFYMYLLMCADGSYYAGSTDDLDKRFGEHQAGSKCGYTHDRRPVKLVFAEAFASREEAKAFEAQVKGWSRAKKAALIARDWQGLIGLARSRRALASAAESIHPVSHEPSSKGGDKPDRPSTKAQG